MSSATSDLNSPCASSSSTFFSIGRWKVLQYSASVRVLVIHLNSSQVIISSSPFGLRKKMVWQQLSYNLMVHEELFTSLGLDVIEIRKHLAFIRSDTLTNPASDYFVFYRPLFVLLCGSQEYNGSEIDSGPLKVAPAPPTALASSSSSDFAHDHPLPLRSLLSQYQALLHSSATDSSASISSISLSPPAQSILHSVMTSVREKRAHGASIPAINSDAIDIDVAATPSSSSSSSAAHVLPVPEDPPVQNWLKQLYRSLISKPTQPLPSFVHMGSNGLGIDASEIELSVPQLECMLHILSSCGAPIVGLRVIVPFSCTHETLHLFRFLPLLKHLNVCNTSDSQLSDSQYELILDCLPQLVDLSCFPWNGGVVKDQLTFSCWFDEYRWSIHLGLPPPSTDTDSDNKDLQSSSVQENIDPDQQWEDECVKAIKQHNVNQLLQLLLQQHLGANTLLSGAHTLLLYAVDEDHEGIINCLLNSGALLEQHTRNYTPLFESAEKVRVTAFKILLLRGANLTGEFDFNKETCLSIASFKLCETVWDIVKKLNIRVDLSVLLHRSYTLLKEQEPYNDWKAFGVCEEPLCFNLARHALFLALNVISMCNENSSVELSMRIDSATLKQLRSRIEVYALAHEKTCIIRGMEERMILSAPQYIASCTVPATNYIINYPVSQSIQKMLKTTMNEKLAHLNSELSKNPSQVNWSAYPSLFIAQYRGLHYYRKHFPTHLHREDHIRTTHLHRIAPAPAVYTMSSLAFGAHQEARETTLQDNAGKLEDFFENLTAEDNTRLQTHMSQDYAGYLSSIRSDCDSPTFRMLYSMKAQAYPHYATSDLPKHALRYAAGCKPIETLKETRLDPLYNSNGAPENPILGKIFVCLMRPQDHAQHRIVHVSTEQGKHLSRYVRPERETSITGAVKCQIIFFEALLRVPDFSQPYNKSIKEEFGLSLKMFSDRKNKVIAASQRAQGDHSLNKEELEFLLNPIIDHYQEKLLRLSQGESLKRGGHLVYCPRKNFYSLYPSALHQDRVRQESKYDAEFGNIYLEEQKLMNKIGEERFEQQRNEDEEKENENDDDEKSPHTQIPPRSELSPSSSGLSSSSSSAAAPSSSSSFLYPSSADAHASSSSLLAFLSDRCTNRPPLSNMSSSLPSSTSSSSSSSSGSSSLCAVELGGLFTSDEINTWLHPDSYFDNEGEEWSFQVVKLSLMQRLYIDDETVDILIDDSTGGNLKRTFNSDLIAGIIRSSPLPASIVFKALHIYFPQADDYSDLLSTPYDLTIEIGILILCLSLCPIDSGFEILLNYVEAAYVDSVNGLLTSHWSSPPKYFSYIISLAYPESIFNGLQDGLIRWSQQGSIVLWWELSKFINSKNHLRQYDIPLILSRLSRYKKAKKKKKRANNKQQGGIKFVDDIAAEGSNNSDEDAASDDDDDDDDNKDAGGDGSDNAHGGGSDNSSDADDINSENSDDRNFICDDDHIDVESDSKDGEEKKKSSKPHQQQTKSINQNYTFAPLPFPCTTADTTIPNPPTTTTTTKRVLKQPDHAQVYTPAVTSSMSSSFNSNVDKRNISQNNNHTTKKRKRNSIESNSDNDDNDNY
jgi:hypothetical protein